MNKKAERINVITESENKNFVHAIVNAVTKGYADRIVFDDVVDLVRRKEITKGVLIASPDALRSYAKHFSESLNYLADQIDSLEINDELTINKKVKKLEQNIVEDELEKIEEPKENKKEACLNKFANLVVSEDIEKYSHNEKLNKISGIVLLKFNENLDKYKSGKNFNLNDEDLKTIISKIFTYYKNEYKNLKANLDNSIFKTNIKVSSVEKGEAFVEYEITGAF